VFLEEASSSKQSDDATPAKKSRFGDWWEEDTDSGTTTLLGIEDEVDLYLKLGRSDSDDPSQLLSWWKAKSTTFKRLAKLAKRVLCIPATSASSERTLSRAGLILTEKRTNLGPKNVCDLLVIHNYFLVNIRVF